MIFSPSHSEATEFASIFAPPVCSLPLSSSRLRLILFMNLSGCRWWAEIRELLKLNPCSSSCSPESRTTSETGGHTLRKTNSREDNALKHFARPMLLLSRRNLLFPSPPSCPSASTNELPLDTDNTTERLTRGSIGKTIIQQVARKLQQWHVVWASPVAKKNYPLQKLTTFSKIGKTRISEISIPRRNKETYCAGKLSVVYFFRASARLFKSRVQPVSPAVVAPTRPRDNDSIIALQYTEITTRQRVYCTGARNTCKYR